MHRNCDDRLPVLRSSSRSAGGTRSRVRGGAERAHLGGGAIVAVAAAAAGRGLAAVPLGRGPGVDAEDVHGVDLLEGAVLGLDDKEVDDDDEGGAASGEDQAVPVVDDVGDEAGAVNKARALSAIKFDGEGGSV